MNLLEYFREQWSRFEGWERIAAVFATVCVVVIFILLTWLISTGGKI